MSSSHAGEMGPDSDVVARRDRRRRLGQAGLQVATAVIALRLGLRLVRAAARALQPPSARKRVAPAPEGELEDDAPGAPRATAPEQWQLLRPAPPQPEAPPGAALVAAADLPISVYQFYSHFLSVDSCRLQDHHRAAGQGSFRDSRWKPDGQGGLTRVFTFVQPKKGVASMPARCVQRHRLGLLPPDGSGGSVSSGSGSHSSGGAGSGGIGGGSIGGGPALWMTTDMQPSGIPYADCFRVQSFWTARPAPRGGCRAEIRVAVPFSRWCVLKGVITNASLSDCREFFSGFLEQVATSAKALGPPGAQLPAALPPSPFQDASAWGPSTPPKAAPAHPLPAAASPRAVRLLSVLLVVVALLQLLLLWEVYVLQRQLPGAAALEAGSAGGGGGAAAGPTSLLAAAGPLAARLLRALQAPLHSTNGALAANGTLSVNGAHAAGVGLEYSLPL